MVLVLVLASILVAGTISLSVARHRAGTPQPDPAGAPTPAVRLAGHQA